MEQVIWIIPGLGLVTLGSVIKLIITHKGIRR